MTETPKLSIYEKAFTKSDKTDAILVVDGKKLHVNEAVSSLEKRPELSFSFKFFSFRGVSF